MAGHMDYQFLRQRSVAFSQSSPMMHERATELRTNSYLPEQEYALADSEILRDFQLDELLSTTLTSLETLLFMSSPR